MSTLLVVEEVLRQRRTPMVVREIVEVAAERLPTKSKTPDTVVARDLAMDIKRRGEDSKFARVAPGRYTLRELAQYGQGFEVALGSTPPLTVAEPEAAPDAGG
jgi:HB1/ASXL restriction endonuclease-like protein with HTH domain